MGCGEQPHFQTVNGESLRTVRVRREGTKLFVIFNGRLFLEMEWRAADELCGVLRQVARQCEELEKAPQIAKDAALLLRAGVPIGLSNDPKINHEAAKIAARDSELRRALPGGIKSEVQLGTPTIISHEPQGQ
jgi:hypothetical protein